MARRNTTRRLFIEKNKENFEAILSSVEAITGHRYLMLGGDPCDLDDVDLVDEFMEALFNEGLKEFRYAITVEEEADYLPDMAYRMGQLRYYLAHTMGNRPSFEKMREYLHTGKGLRRPRKQIRKD